MKINKILSVILAMAMILGTITISASATSDVADEAVLADVLETGGTIVLEKDIELTSTLYVKKDVTFDLNGYKLTGPDVPATNSYYAFVVDGGNLTLKDSSESQTGEIWAKCYGVETKSGSFVMESGKITATNNKTLGAAVVNYGGTVTIKGGTLSAAESAVYTSGYFSDAITSIESVTVTAGNVIIENMKDEYTESVKSKLDTDKIIDGCGWKLGDDGFYELIVMPIIVTYADGTSKYFAEMTDAVPNSNKNTMDGATIKLLDNYTGSGVRFFDDVILDLNSFTYTVTKSAGSKGTETSGFQIRPESNGVTIKNGTIAVAEQTEGSVVWLLNSYTDVKLENVILDCTNLAKSAYGDSCMAIIAHDETFEIRNNSKIINFNEGLSSKAIAVAVADNANYDGGISMIIDDSVEIDGKVEIGKGEASITTNGNFIIVSKDGYKPINTNGVYTAFQIASAIEVGFVKTADEREYNIVLKGVDGAAINDFESAHFTFANGNVNEENIDYTITPNADANITAVADLDNEDRISFYRNADDKNNKEIEEVTIYTDGENEIKGIILGTVRFEGYGDVNFSIDSDDAKVNATTVYDNIVETYTPYNKAHTLTLRTDDFDEVKFIEQQRALNVVINFNNDVAKTNDACYNDMTVTVTGTNGYIKTGKVGSECAEAPADVYAQVGDDNVATLKFTGENALPAGYRYTVKVEGAGYRTAEYTTVVGTDSTDDVTLTFWNNVKDEFNKTEIESGSERWYTKNFLAGEIVQDNEINKYDLAAVVSYFGEDELAENRPEYNKYDLNRDGVIDSEDIAYVLVSFGE